MKLNENDEFCYVLDIREFDDIPDTGELMDILMDEYRLDAKFNDRYTLNVYAYNDAQVDKLERMMNDYGASDEYINLVLTGEIKENKNINFNMKHGINECRRNLVLRKKDGCGCGRKLNENKSLYNTKEEILEEFESFIREKIQSWVNSKRDTIEDMEKLSYEFDTAEEHFSDIFDQWVEYNNINKNVANNIDWSEYSNLIDKCVENEIEYVSNKYECWDYDEEDDDRWDEEWDDEDDLDETVDNSDLDDLYHSLFESEEKAACKCRYKGKLISKMDKNAKRDAKVEVREEIKNLKKQIKEAAKAGKSTKAMDAKLEKLEHVLDCLMGKCEADKVNESISDRFASRRRLFESEEDETEDEKPTEDEPVDDDKPVEDEPVDDAKADDNADNEEEYEDVEMKAVVLTVLKKDLDKVKEELVDAGISEDNIDMPDCEDAKDDDECEIRIDAEAVAELAEYLKGKGIDLEEEIGGEIVDTAEEDAVEDEVEKEEGSDEEPADDTTEEPEFDESNLDDIFK